MAKKSKIIYIVGSIVIGVAALLIVFFGLIAGGVINAKQNKLIFTSASQQFIYDGTAHTDGGWTLKSGSLTEGHKAVVEVSGSRTETGSSENYISARIVDESGADVTGNYDIEYQPGKLTVLPMPITVVSDDVSKVYDGTELIGEGFRLADGKLAEGHVISASFTSSITDAGSTANNFTVGITDENGEDKTYNYAVTCHAGTLSVTQRPIKLQSAGAEKVYDATALINEEWSITEGELISGEELSVQFADGITDAGKADNKFTASVFSGDGVNLTANYAIEYDYGVLTVIPRTVKISTADDKKEYDGLPLTNGNYEIIEAHFLEGHTAEITVDGIQIEAGSSKNTFKLTVFDSDGADVTKNYKAEELTGTLTVIGRKISISTVSSAKIYDGTPLTCQEWSVVSGTQLLEGHSFSSVLMPAAITDVGTQDNYISEIRITDENGNDVTDSYEITFFEGKLSVMPRQITIRSGSDSKIYDGLPLTCGEYEIVSSTQPVTGHDLQVEISGIRIEVGESPNTIAEVLIYDENGTEVTYNYSITLQLGDLVVKNPDGTDGDKDPGETGGDLNQSGNIGGNGNGQPGEDGEDEETRLALRVLSDESGSIYLRLMSFGDYTGTGWTEGLEYDLLLDGQFSYNYLTSVALKSAGYNSTHVSIEVIGNDYMLPYYADLGGGLYEIQTSDVKYSGSTADVYSLYYFLYNYAADGAIYPNLGAYSQAEAAYAKFVHNNYLDVPSQTKSALSDLINGLKNTVNQNDIYDVITKVASYVQGAATYNLNYNANLDGERDMVTSFLLEYKEGVCRHYASAATVIYRMLGIPARYVIGYVGNTTAGDWVEITTQNAHAWVEVYIDGTGWVQIEVTGGGPGMNGGGLGGNGDGSDGNGGSGSNEGTDGKLTVKPITEYIPFDGYEHSHSGALQGLSDLTNKGYTYKAVVSGSTSTAGKTECKITSFILYDPDGNDVTAQYDIKLNTGILQVYLSEITVETENPLPKIYDGTAFTAEGIKYSGSILQGHTVKILQTTGRQIGVGVSLNTYKIVIIDAYGNDVTDVYKINGKYGSLEVKPCTVTVTADSAEKVYDGNALTCPSYKIEGLAAGHTAKVIVQGTQTRIGRSDNVVGEVIIYDAYGNDVTENYNIIKVTGLLQVKPN